MDAEQRAVAVKARMAEMRAQHLPMTRPCSECRFGPIDGSGLGICEHYANWEISVDPVRGKRRGRVVVTTTDARSVDGLCGPEGLLFESYPRWWRLHKHLSQNQYVMVYYMFGLTTVTALLLVLYSLLYWVTRY